MRTFPLSAIALALILAALPGQARTEGPFVPPEPPQGALRTDSGLAMVVLAPGTGKVHPRPQDFVRLDYVLKNEHDQVVDETAGMDFPPTLLTGRLVKGMAEGVQLMVEGERRRIWIPAALGFPAGKGRLSGPLILEVTLLAVDTPPSQAPEDLTQPPADAVTLRSGLRYRILRKGAGTACPTRSDTVVVHYTGWTQDGRSFDSTLLRREPANFKVGEVIKGWTEGLRLMNKGDRFRFWIPEKLAYRGEEGKPAGILVFDVELLGFYR